LISIDQEIIKKLTPQLLIFYTSNT